MLHISGPEVSRWWLLLTATSTEIEILVSISHTPDAVQFPDC